MAFRLSFFSEFIYTNNIELHDILHLENPFYLEGIPRHTSSFIDTHTCIHIYVVICITQIFSPNIGNMYVRGRILSLIYMHEMFKAKNNKAWY